MAAASTHQRYESMAVIHFTLSGEPDCGAISIDIASTLQTKYFFGKVTHVDERTLGLAGAGHEDGRDISDEVEQAFVEWLEANKPKAGEKKLFFVGYFGHGNIEPRGKSPSVWQYHHLFAYS